MNEFALGFGPGKSLSGVYTCSPETGTGDSGFAVVFLNAGIVHQVGPGRLYVKAARRLAASGIPTLRFDLSGIGDSPPRGDNVPFSQSAVEETSAALDFLEETYGLRRFLLAGICTGAVVSFRTAIIDKRVRSVMLINAQDYGAAELAAEIQHRSSSRYVMNSALKNPRSWLKFLTGKADYKSVATSLRLKLVPSRQGKEVNSEKSGEIASQFEELLACGQSVYAVFSEGDPSLDEFQLILGDKLAKLGTSTGFQRKTFHATDHMFTILSRQHDLLAHIDQWAKDQTITQTTEHACETIK